MNLSFTTFINPLFKTESMIQRIWVLNSPDNNKKTTALVRNIQLKNEPKLIEIQALTLNKTSKSLF